MIFVLLAIFICLATGFYFLLADIFKLPTLKTSRALKGAVTTKLPMMQLVDEFYYDQAMHLGKWIPLSKQKEERLKNELFAAGLEYLPQTYVANAYLRAGTILLLAIIFLFFMPFLSFVLLFVSWYVYYKQITRARVIGEERKAKMEGEYYRFVSTIAEELKNTRDVPAILSHYAENAGEYFQRELGVLLADMRSSSYEAALIRFEARMNDPQISDITRGLVGVLHGDDGVVYFQMLTFDFKEKELQRLKAKAAKIPPKIRIHSMIMLICYIATFLVVIVSEIMKAMDTMF